MKNKKSLIAVLSVLLVAALVIGGTIAYLTASDEVVNKFVVGNIDPDIEEPEWPEPPVVNPGDTIKKDPIITAGEDSNDMYFRVVMEVREASTTDDVTGETTLGAIITDADRLALILNTLYRDLGYPDNDTLDTDEKYTLAELASMISDGDIENIKNITDFAIDAGRTTPGKYVYNYTKNSGIFSAGDSVYFMTHLVVPTDYNNAQCKLMGKYEVTFRLEAIQSANFATQAEAMTALDTEIANG